MRICSFCNKAKTEDKFYKNARIKCGLMRACKLCFDQAKRDKLAALKADPNYVKPFVDHKKYEANRIAKHGKRVRNRKKPELTC